ncbi:hypothetical protein [Streptomyces sp. NEAU-YJ-81]|uniref:hypothetical protein n=1 Tax=Streptomyces sp. NEAU-YJ-81 TaxID=2820288 RepID=UPI001ABCCDA0|nr:hypothetical protein [Streptomyces sp. NEAU-YJ-81]MBO3674870.1 hypothetical protein [Streptomyces sp. NEAU-YJ-81]
MSETRTHLQELAALQRQASLLWSQILGGQDTPLLRERVMRLETIQAALLWEAPQMLAACGSCGRAPEALPAA